MANSHIHRIALVTTDYPPDVGGLQTYSYRIARDLPHPGLSHILAGSDHAFEDSPPPAPGAALLLRRGRTRWSALRWSLWSVPWLRWTQGVPFFIHMQWTTAIPSMILKRLGTGTGYLVLVHGAELIDPGRPFLALLRKAVLSGADAVVAGSRHTAEIVSQSGIRCRRLEVIPYGNPLEGRDGGIPSARLPESSTEDTGPARLLCMHRLVARKGTALLLAALAGLRDLSWTLDVVGRGEAEAALREQARCLGILDRIRFLPPVSEAEKIRLLTQATLFILPSLPPIANNHIEGLGLTLLEAQSMGLPVLAARTGGIPEAVLEGRTGTLFRAGDAEDLREKLAALLASPETRKAMSCAGPDWVRGHFSWKDGLGRLSALLSEIAGERS